MSNLKLICKKGCLDRWAYTELTDEELDIKRGDRVDEANNPQEEFIFFEWRKDQRGNVYAYCRASYGTERSFYPDSVRKAKSQINEEHKQARKEAKRLRDETKREKQAAIKANRRIKQSNKGSRKVR